MNSYEWMDEQECQKKDNDNSINIFDGKHYVRKKRGGEGESERKRERFIVFYREKAAQA